MSTGNTREDTFREAWEDEIYQGHRWGARPWLPSSELLVSLLRSQQLAAKILAESRSRQ